MSKPDNASALPIIEIRGLSKRYRMPANRASSDDAAADDSDVFWALKDIDLDIYEGERVGIIGRNGAGKSTLLKILSRVIYPSDGEARIRGRVTSLLEVGTGFNNNATGRENVYLNASLHGLSRTEVDGRFDDIVAFAELRSFIDVPIKHYSSGMRSRLAFAVAAHLDPDVLILDEVLAVGDIAFQQKCLARMSEVTSRGRTLIFVSHSVGSITQFCNRCIWMEKGRIIMDGSAQEVTESYSSRLLGAVAHIEFSTPERPAQHSTAAAEQAAGSETWAQLVSATVSNAAGDPRLIFAADEDVYLDVTFEVTDDRRVLPAFRVYQDNLLIFTVAFWEQRPPEKTGRYRARARIPGFLLAPGDFEVSIGLNTPVVGRLIRHQVAERALSFTVRDVVTGHSPRGPYVALKGAVRPFFDWKVERLG